MTPRTVVDTTAARYAARHLVSIADLEEMLEGIAFPQAVGDADQFGSPIASPTKSYGVTWKRSESTASARQAINTRSVALRRLVVDRKPCLH